LSIRKTLYKGVLQAVRPFILIHRKVPLEVKALANRHCIVSGVISLSGKRFYIGHSDENTFFRTASLTKLVTTFGVMKCGLDLDAPISSYTNLSLKNITLRQLMSHTSPLCDGDAYEHALLSPVDLNTLLENPSVWKKEPGFRYSNLGFGIVGSVLECVTGESLELWMQKNVFTPLKMNCTYDITTLTHAKDIYRLVPPQRAFDFNLRKAKASPILKTDPQRHFTLASGNLYSDTLSLEKALDVIRENDGSFISKEAICQMKTPHAEYGASSPMLAYGLGLLIVRGKETLYGHQGFAYGCVNSMFFAEKSGKTLISLNNGANEARFGRMGELNRDLIQWGFE
jgi:Beta-lactamase class C and other penicillin binding proteins